MKIKFLVILILGLLAGTTWGQEPDDFLKVYFFDVGQGDSILLEWGDQQILVDGGRGGMVLERLGDVMGLDNTIELVVITHFDQDHVGGLLKVLDEYKVDKVLVSGYWEGVGLEQDFKEKGVVTEEVKVGQQILLGDAVIGVMYPFGDIKDRNDSSIVLKVEYGECSMLLTGDLEGRGEQRLVEEGFDLESDVLKVGHHGSKNASGESFLQEVGPEWGVISAGKNNQYGHPHPDVVKRLKGVQILRTDQQGNILFEGRGNACELEKVW